MDNNYESFATTDLIEELDKKVAELKNVHSSSFPTILDSDSPFIVSGELIKLIEFRIESMPFGLRSKAMAFSSKIVDTYKQMTSFIDRIKETERTQRALDALNKSMGKSSYGSSPTDVMKMSFFQFLGNQITIIRENLGLLYNLISEWLS